MVDEPIRQHGGASVGQGANRSQIGLKTTGKQQDPLPSQPAGKRRLQLRVDGATATDQT